MHRISKHKTTTYNVCRSTNATAYFPSEKSEIMSVCFTFIGRKILLVTEENLNYEKDETNRNLKLDVAIVINIYNLPTVLYSL